MKLLFHPDGSLKEEKPSVLINIANNFAAPPAPPQVSMLTMHLNDNEERVVKTGVYLHLTEAIKLVRFMSSTMNIGDSDLDISFQVNKYKDAELF